MAEGLLVGEEMEDFKQELATFWKLVEAECETNPKVMISLYELLKTTRDWDNKTLCERLQITEKTLGEFKKHHRPMPEGVGLKMLYELLPQMAV